MSRLNVAVMVKLEPDLSEGNVSYNPDGTLNRSKTKNILGPHSAIACKAAFYAKIKHDAKINICTMGPPLAEVALKQGMEICSADELHLYSDRIFAGADTLATAETIKTGIEKMRDIELVFSGHRAVDGETGQTGPQTAWKLGFNFVGNVIDYSIDMDRRFVKVIRRLDLQGLYTVMEELEVPLPVLLTIDPSYKEHYTKVSERLKYVRLKKEAKEKVGNYKDYLKVWDAESLGVDPKKVGLAGSPTIVYKVEKIPRAKARRSAEILTIDEKDQIVKKILEVVNP
ncbi:MAG: electron transfer flavoprotein subunit beta [Candidatus Nitrosocaldaceae archaeon]|nr:MAG: electron transfer flavoprotein subunit beta [Candidatus Nitrosocaldaceae archaeon]